MKYVEHFVPCGHPLKHQRTTIAKLFCRKYYKDINADCKPIMTRIICRVQKMWGKIHSLFEDNNIFRFPAYKIFR